MNDRRFVCKPSFSIKFQHSLKCREFLDVLRIYRFLDAKYLGVPGIQMETYGQLH
jgi:hypothetical protein